MGYTGKKQEILMKAWALQDICVCLSHVFDVFLSASAHFMPGLGLKYFKIPFCFFISFHYSSWHDAFYMAGAQKLKLNKETEAQNVTSHSFPLDVNSLINCEN